MCLIKAIEMIVKVFSKKMIKNLKKVLTKLNGTFIIINVPSNAGVVQW